MVDHIEAGRILAMLEESIGSVAADHYLTLECAVLDLKEKVSLMESKINALEKTVKSIDKVMTSLSDNVI